jgi:hypothetical protein
VYSLISAVKHLRMQHKSLDYFYHLLFIIYYVIEVLVVFKRAAGNLGFSLFGLTYEDGLGVYLGMGDVGVTNA